ncbi:ribbon-helix-helix domain-containing protein [Jiella pacifica]|uniref:Type II toxin-antitoxin system ParD family antitoxin n=1 Tax=Jiella pacifica TaxID=2696469 RepID=A0A6N9T2I8_9HYPH|nr:type II toxin-antitoxin system ParD family antitoxin [Jiella pacifica]NDW04246.1 type II toxin-antitoxin system ParD family antitoxin [Jiella pacifica]
MAIAEKLSVELPADMLRTIRESVEAGSFGSESEALQEAVRAWQREREDHERQLEEIRAKIDRSLNDPRPSLTSEEMRARMERFMSERRAGQGPATR